MDSFSLFRTNVIEKLCMNYYCYEDGECAGFRILTSEKKANISNTVEALLILEILDKSFLNKQDLNEKFQFDKIKTFLTKQYGIIKTYSYEHIRTIHLAYCGTGLLMLGEIAIAEEISRMLLDSQDKNDFGGWGQTLVCERPNVLPTYYACQLLNRMHKKISIPLWINNIKFDYTGCSFLPDDRTINGYKNIASLALIGYMRRYYYKDENKLREINSILNKYYKTTKLRVLYNSTGEDIVKEPESGYDVFAFGLAAHAVKFEKNSFLSKDYEKYVSCIPDRFTDVHEKSIPYILEMTRYIKALKDTYDPFEAKEDLNFTGSVHTISDAVVLKLYMSVSISIILYFLLVNLTQLVGIAGSDMSPILFLVSCIIPFVLTYKGVVTDMWSLMSKLINGKLKKMKNRE